MATARVGLGGLLLDRRQQPLARGDGSVTAVLARLHALAAPLLAAAGTPPVGVGVAVPGIVGAADGTVRLAPNLGWVDVPLGALLADGLGTAVPVAVGNEGDSASSPSTCAGSRPAPRTRSTSPVRSASAAGSSSAAGR